MTAELCRDLAADTIKDRIRLLVDTAPPLTDGQRDRLRALLAPTGLATHPPAGPSTPPPPPGHPSPGPQEMP
jgi:hypothetical protein